MTSRILISCVLAGLLAPGANAHPQTVVLDEDRTVEARLATVSEYVAAARWSEAIAFLETIIESSGDRLVRVSPDHYISVRRACQQLLATLPPEALQGYRAQIDPRARQWLNRGRRNDDPASLRRLLDEAPLSSFGDEALYAIGLRDWQAGRAGRAYESWKRLLPAISGEATGLSMRFPDARYDPAQVSARLVLCRLAMGYPTFAARELEALEAHFPDATGTVGGVKGRLGDLLKAELNRPWRPANGLADSPTLGGIATRGGLQSSPGTSLSQAWAAAIDGPTVARLVDDRLPAAFSQRLPLRLYPIVVDNVVFACDAFRIYAFDLHSGRNPWIPATADSSPTDAVIYDTPVVHPQRLSSGTPHFSLSADSGRLYARLGCPVTGRTDPELNDLTSEVVCLDVKRREGKLLWRVVADDLLPDAAFEASPVISGGRCFVALRRSPPRNALHVVCLDAEDGSVLWNRPVCGGIDAPPASANLITSLLLAATDETVFFSTNSGAIAALDALTGTVLWVHTYPRSQLSGTDDGPRQVGPLPVVVVANIVYAAPPDAGGTILALNASTGGLLWERALPDRIQHVLGVSRETLVVTGRSPWGLDALTGRVIWGAPRHDAGTFGHGRGLLTTDRLLWPRRDRIEVRDPATGNPVATSVDLEALGCEGGNLCSADGHLISAEPGRIVVFSP